MEQLSSGSLGYITQSLNPTIGDEELNFPMEISGTAQCDPCATFVADNELQRVALIP